MNNNKIPPEMNPYVICFYPALILTTAPVHAPDIIKLL